MVKKLLTVCLLLTWAALSVFAQKFDGPGYDITIRVRDLPNSEVYLAYYYGDKQYIKDTLNTDATGTVKISGQDTLKSGIYLFVLPEKRYFEFLVSEKKFSLETDKSLEPANMVVKGSVENTIFYQDLVFINKKQKEAEALKKQLDELPEESKEREKNQKQLEGIDKAVKEQRRSIISSHPNTFYAALLRALEEPEVPEPPADLGDVSIEEWRFNTYKRNFLKGLDYTDDRLLRTPVLHNKTNRYLTQLTLQQPDSIIRELDFLLEKARPNAEVFKYLLISELNNYAKSKIMGMDAVYVHLVENYYAKGLTPWVDEVQLAKIIDNAKSLKPLLIGKKAPPLYLKDLSGTYRNLYEVKSPFTALIFWDPDCGHCKKTIPTLLDMYENFKAKGIEIYSVSTETEEDKWRNFIKEHNLDKWINVADIELKSNFRGIYDIRSTPVVYLLDEQKMIIAKRIGLEQIEEVADRERERKERMKSR